MTYQKADFWSWHLGIVDTFEGIEESLCERRRFSCSIENAITGNFEYDLPRYWMGPVKTASQQYYSEEDKGLGHFNCDKRNHLNNC